MYTERHKFGNCCIARQIRICCGLESGVYLYVCLGWLRRVRGRGRGRGRSLVPCAFAVHSGSYDSSTPSLYSVSMLILDVSCIMVLE